MPEDLQAASVRVEELLKMIQDQLHVESERNQTIFATLKSSQRRCELLREQINALESYMKSRDTLAEPEPQEIPF